MLALLYGVGLAATNNPVANPKAVIVYGNARFTVLTPRLIRLEWSEDGAFEDRATLAIVNRDLPVPDFKVQKNAKRLIIKTSDLTLEYRGSEEFSAGNLSIRSNGSTWHPGDDASGNLLGTSRTLDGYTGDTPADGYEQGLLSRDGWALIDESTRQVFVPTDEDWEYWVDNRPAGKRQDWYFLGYGHDYKAALGDFTKIAGKIPLPPKYAFGYWWCRYWEYSDNELLDLAKHFRDFDIPIDVMIIDMDWHETWTELRFKMSDIDFSGNYLGWTGYTWKKELFPNPTNFLAELHSYGVKTSLNLHFQSGIQPFEEPYKRFVEDYLSRTDDYDGPKGYKNEDGSDAYVPYRMSQIEWADAYFNSVIRPFEKQGIDFWWQDWQQWPTSKYLEGLNNTFWLNYCFFQDKVRQTKTLGSSAPRAMIYHRWGGLGSHRYQVGFSGDTYATWEVLKTLPYFTATASNVGYAYWGHDIGGHMQPSGVRFTDPELYTRWLQSGVFTPIFKTHSTKDETMEKRFWVFPDHFEAMKDAVRLRYDLAPYIYTAAREAYDSGVGICRPLYYEYPEVEKAYNTPEEFFFGDGILASGVFEKVDEVTGLAPRSMWFPEGCDWYDCASGQMYSGGSTHDLSYTISENPWYIPAASLIPLSSSKIASLQEDSNDLRILIAPGDGSRTFTLYEDDGTTEAYSSEFATTAMSHSRKDHSSTVTIDARSGSYADMPSSRKISLLFDSTLPPTNVVVNGVEVPYSRFAASADAPVWGYEGNEVRTVVYLGEVSASQQITVRCEWPSEESLAYGKKGLIKRMMALSPEAKLVYGSSGVGRFQLPDSFLNVSQCGSYLTEDPSGAVGYLQAIDSTEVVSGFRTFEDKLPAAFLQKIEAQSK